MNRFSMKYLRKCKLRTSWVMLAIKNLPILGVKTNQSALDCQNIVKNYNSRYSKSKVTIFKQNNPIKPFKNEFSPDNYVTPSNRSAEAYNCLATGSGAPIEVHTIQLYITAYDAFWTKTEHF